MKKSRELFQQIVKELSDHYTQNEAESLSYRLLNHFFHLERKDIILNSPIEKSTTLLQPYLQRLKVYEPIQYILGEEEFMNLNFCVNPNVLIPRPETEELVQLLLSENTIPNPTILDIGTGSGCIPISLAKNITNSKVSSIDISQKAIEVAQKNAKTHQVHVNFIHQNILEINELKETYDLIISNPPYVRELEKDKMHQNVLDHEPQQALFVSDNDPLIFYRHIMKIANTNLKKGGKLYFEINEALGKELLSLAKNYHFEKSELKKDFLEKDRFLILTQSIKSL